MSKRWWCATTLLGLGEVGNFTAYGFAPIALIAPLGCVSVIGETVCHFLLGYINWRLLCNYRNNTSETAAATEGENVNVVVWKGIIHIITWTDSLTQILYLEILLISFFFCGFAFCVTLCPLALSSWSPVSVPALLALQASEVGGWHPADCSELWSDREYLQCIFHVMITPSGFCCPSL